MGLARNVLASAGEVYQGMVQGDLGSFYGVPGSRELPDTQLTVAQKRILMQYFNEHVNGHSTRTFEDWLVENW